MDTFKVFHEEVDSASHLKADSKLVGVILFARELFTRVQSMMGAAPVSRSGRTPWQSVEA